MPEANSLILVGIGYRPLDERARERVLGAEVLLASSRLHEVFQRYPEYDQVKDRIKVINKVPDTIAFIREHLFASPLTPHASRMSIVLLASGDPCFFGICRRMIEEFGRERVEILPDLSSMQVAFSRNSIPWDDAVFISLHGGPDIAKRRTLPFEVKDIPQLLERTGKMGILTDRVNNPGVVAKELVASHRTPQSSFVMYVCERLGYPDERITSGTPAEMAVRDFSDPNVVIIQKTEGRRQETEPENRQSGVRSQESGKNQKQSIRFGLREDDIAHERGLITKDEVRAVTIHKLRLPQSGVLWDIGAGSGSVSLEAARLCPELRVIAIEQDQERGNTIRENAGRFNARNLEIIYGAAPDSLPELPAPDRVFIGGSGGNLGLIVKEIQRKMASGIVVINAATLDTLHEALAALEANGFSAEVSEISVSRSKVVAGKRLMAALNPVFVITGRKINEPTH